MSLRSNSNNNIQNSAVGSQFQLWNQEKARFLDAAKQTDAQRERLVHELDATEAAKKQLTLQIQTVSNKLGRFHNERDMLMTEKRQLTEQLAKERCELETSATEQQQQKVQAGKAKSSFLKEMDALNDELGDMLCKHEHLRLQNLVTSGTVQLLIDNNGNDCSKRTEELQQAAQELNVQTATLEQVLNRNEHLKGLLTDFRKQAKGTPFQTSDGTSAKEVRLRLTIQFRSIRNTLLTLYTTILYTVPL
jgi:predicted  nucleic acid-binding Zn-ribbon protein